MNDQSKKRASGAAFLVIGISFMILGMTSSATFYGAGAGFMIAGISALARHRKSDRESGS